MVLHEEGWQDIGDTLLPPIPSEYGIRGLYLNFITVVGLRGNLRHRRVYGGMAAPPIAPPAAPPAASPIAPPTTPPAASPIAPPAIPPIASFAISFVYLNSKIMQPPICI
ncbi:predicted protein [Botrytis cinerea T4]|uniref:Uncharacterized protein n=1 Tax=Botryotinia fuckeliana (strain T4) TaxID=999810 RepID=G2YJY2_BOTF4|nr:predicted protein [Botrytis cinerea T4]